MVDGEGGLLIGVDLQKDNKILDAAYNDKEGFTARFNKNLLSRINRELDADFDLHQFLHRAFFNEEKHRIEMRLISLRQQLAESAGFNRDATRVDEMQLFSVHYLDALDRVQA